MRYIVTNVRLEEPVYRALKLHALERGVPASVVIREAIRERLKSAASKKIDWEHEKAELLKLCGIGRSKGGGVSTASTDLDDVLYGPRRYRPKRR
jgi:hypothetical protein